MQGGASSAAQTSSEKVAEPERITSLEPALLELMEEAGVMGYETTSTSNLKSGQKHELHSRVFQLEHAIRQLTGSPVVKPKEPEPEGCM